MQLDGESDRRTQHSLIQLFDRELESLRTVYKSCWSQELEIDLQGAKLYLYALCFLTEESLSLGEVGALNATFSFKVILHEGLASAVQLIHNLSELANAADPVLNSPHGQNGTGHLLFLSKPNFTNAFFAAIFLLKFLAAVPDAAQHDRDLAINHITLAHRIFSYFPTARDHWRGAVLIEVLGRLLRSGGYTADLHVKSRLGSSLVSDASWRAGQWRMRLLKPGDNLNSWLNYEALGGLPLAPEQEVKPQQTGIAPESVQTGQAPPDGGWSWGFWDDAIFDLLGPMADFDMTGLQDDPVF